ncbi:KxYKxGKxW signal peptide domain-containing protein, partial [Ligilactobacillus sp. WILCCON 0076]
MKNKHRGLYTESDRSTHVKMYKAGKQWVSSLISDIGLLRIFGGKGLSEVNMEKVTGGAKRELKTTTAAKAVAAIGAFVGGGLVTTSSALADTTNTAVTKTVTADSTLAVQDSTQINGNSVSQSNSDSLSLSESESISSSLNESVSQSTSASVSESTGNSISDSTSTESVSESSSSSISESVSSSISESENVESTSESANSSISESENTGSASTSESETGSVTFDEYKSNVISYLSSNNMLENMSVDSADFQNALSSSYATLSSAPSTDAGTPTGNALWMILYLTAGFTNQPSDINTIVNTTATTTATTTASAADIATGAWFTTYQWYRYDATTGKWSAVRGATSATLTVNQSQAGTYYYQLRAQIKDLLFTRYTMWSRVVTVNVAKQEVNADKVVVYTDDNYIWVNDGATKAYVSVEPENYTGTVKWSSSATNIATVDKYGNIKAGSIAGKVTITATIVNPDGTTVKSSVTITVGNGLENQKVTEGNTAQFVVQGTPDVSNIANASVVYVWHKIDAQTGEDTIVQTGSSAYYNVKNASLADSGDRYYAVITIKVSSLSESYKTNTATLTVVVNSTSRSASTSISESTSTSISESNSASTSAIVSESTSESASM